VGQHAPDPLAPDSPAADPLAPVLGRLAALAGFAPTEVLRGRLARAGALLHRLDPEACALDEPGWAALLDAVTVQETRMFRAAAQLQAFRAEALPALLALGARTAARPLVLVSAGCATGEEAWTLAILAARGGAAAWRVLGLDLCRPALAVAEAARYPLGPPDALREMPAEDRALLAFDATHFTPAAALRPRVAFRRANLLDPGLPEAGADAILCRNVLIYLTAAARVAVLRRLVAALRPGGALLLGATDSPPPGFGLTPWGPPSAGMWRREGTGG
jgi:chemotaxis protein methyltransferase CheR